MTCAVITQDAMASAVSVSWPHQATNQPSPFAPVENTEDGPNSDGMTRFIASRCLKLKFRSNESRKAYLRIHRALATYSVGDV